MRFLRGWFPAGLLDLTPLIAHPEVSRRVWPTVCTLSPARSTRTPTRG